jgi:hypothetical protein
MDINLQLRLGLVNQFIDRYIQATVKKSFDNALHNNTLDRVTEYLKGNLAVQSKIMAVTINTAYPDVFYSMYDIMKYVDDYIQAHIGRQVKEYFEEQTKETAFYGSSANPVYGSNGKYRGTTKEGFSGEPIIYDGDLDFKNLGKDKLIDAGGILLSNYCFDDQFYRDMIESHIANFQLSDGLDLAVQVCVQYDPNIGHAAYNATKATLNNTIIRRGKYNDQYFEPTVENLRNVINLHEVKQHVLANIEGTNSGHIKIYQSQVNHKQFVYTTRRFKQFTALNYYSVHGNFNTNYNFINLYHSYGKNILDRYNNWENSSFNSNSSQYFSIFK